MIGRDVRDDVGIVKDGRKQKWAVSYYFAQPYLLVGCTSVDGMCRP